MFSDSFDFPTLVPFLLSNASGVHSVPACLTAQEAGLKDGRVHVRVSVAVSSAIRPFDDALEDESFEPFFGDEVYPLRVIETSYCGGAACEGPCEVYGACGRSTVDRGGRGYFASRSFGCLLSAVLVELGFENVCCEVTISISRFRLEASLVGGIRPGIAALDATVSEVFFKPDNIEPVADVVLPDVADRRFVAEAAKVVLDPAVLLDPAPPEPLEVLEVPCSGVEFGGGEAGVVGAVAFLDAVVKGERLPPDIVGFVADAEVEVDRRLAVLRAGGVLPRGCYSVVGDHNWFELLCGLVDWFAKTEVPLRGARLDLLLGSLSCCNDDRERALRLLRFLGSGAGGDESGLGPLVLRVPFTRRSVDVALRGLVWPEGWDPT